MPLTISEIAELVDGELTGNSDELIRSVSSPQNAGPHDLIFISDESGFSFAEDSAAGCVIAPMAFASSIEKPLIRVLDPKKAFAIAGSHLHPRKDRPAEIHPSAVIAKGARIGDNVFIGAFCCVGEGSEVGDGTHLRAGVKIGNGVKIGPNCTLHQNVTVEDGVLIGSGVILKSGAVIGSKGFGFVRDGQSLIKFPQIGTVVIEDDVEIGANSCVDRGALGETRIGEGTKIDNLVQIAHNVKIGKRVVIAALVGVSGSVEIGDDCVVGGQTGFADHTKIEDGVVIGAKSAVFPGKHVRSGVWAGIPVLPISEYKRLNAHIRALPRLREEVRELGEVLRRLESLVQKGSGEE
ncbi:MAG: UDP-3-O-(3-hydroxymyristoyl)glucosamine N-acyltransferase [Acidobacteria bacterium]|nr:MAG: UDP-3-O-(3-hydroxymyristoyl)glucosamine N-acyltransferase [Acidobacteriota bacterium]REK01752.1 MAG: UDP-3-O-(3-hydroxymyristoyl)glucosamine N-acyltransferase [Acidobacteriota bacterium]REK14708.1 MAG: UDP-3-O-(3-hydroxymyristoyl)glucosamine N-acyltransferase [Acidobacteriota bacterium]REK45423.1 MAG: UDP-3-O-(3-hydroxymyristoyl)glucosamine N-acyltransferase [Acidobacteriota bacterium]